MVASSKIEETITDYPAVMKNASSTHLKDNAQSTGADIAWASDDGETTLDYERREYSNTTGLITVVVEKTVSSSAGATYFMYYGNSGAGEQQDIPGTWNSDFYSVHSLIEDPTDTPPEYKDSVGSQDATEDGTLVTAAALWGQGMQVTYNTAHWADIPDQQPGDEISVYCIFQRTGTAFDARLITRQSSGASGDHDFMIGTTSSGIKFRARINLAGTVATLVPVTPSIAQDKWYFLALTRTSGSDVDLYIGEITDSNWLGSGASTTGGAVEYQGTTETRIGSGTSATHTMTGELAEARIESAGHTEAYFETLFNNFENVETFATWDAYEAVAEAGPSTKATNNIGETASLTWTDHKHSPGDNKFLLVTVGIFKSGGSSVSGVTYDGNALTFKSASDRANGETCEIWYLKDTDHPTADAVHDIVVTATASSQLQCVASNYVNVHQSTPFAASAEADGSSTTPSVTLTGAAGEVTVAVVAFNDRTPTLAAEDIQVEYVDNGANNDSNLTFKNLGVSTAINVTLDTSADWAMCAVVLQEAPDAPVPVLTSIDDDILRPNTIGAVLTGTDFGATTEKVWLGDDSDFGSANLVQLNTTSWADTSITFDSSDALGESREGHYIFVETPGGVSAGLQVTVSHPDVKWEFREYTTTADANQTAVSNLDPDHPPVYCMVHWNSGKTGASISGTCGFGMIDLAGNDGYVLTAYRDGETIRSLQGFRVQNNTDFIRIHEHGDDFGANFRSTAALTSTGIDLTTSSAEAGYKLQFLFLCGRTAKAHVGMPAVSADALTGASFPSAANAMVFASACALNSASLTSAVAEMTVGWSDGTNAFCTTLSNTEGGSTGALSKTFTGAAGIQYTLNSKDWVIPVPTGTTTGCTWVNTGTPGSDNVLCAALWLDGVQFEVGDFTKTTSTPGPVSQSITTTFNPTGILLSTGGKVNQDETIEESFGCFSYGYAVSPEHQFHGFITDRLQSTESDKEMVSGTCLSIGTDSASADALGNFIGFTPTSVDLEFSPNTSDATIIGYVLFRNTRDLRKHHVGGNLL